MTRVAVEGLHKFFGEVKAVVDLTLTVEEGECLCLLGPSGCGKTTTLHCLAGLENPTSGTIRFGNVAVNHLPPRARNVGLVFQSYALFLHMTVYRNIAFGLEIQGSSREDLRKEVDRLAELLHLSHLLNAKAGRLSLSDMQRVALARTLITRPALLILDEPLSNLDASVRDTMRAELKRLQKDLRQTVIYVTHDQLEAMSLADNIAIMNLGVLQQVGPPDEVYHRPANLFVAGFIGNPPMNFVEGTIRSEGGDFWFDSPGFRCPIDGAGSGRANRESRKIILGIRPEQIEPIGNGGAKEGIPGQVVLAEKLGRRTLLSVQIGGDVLRAQGPEQADFASGQNIGLRFNRDALRFFDAETGNSLAEEL